MRTFQPPLVSASASNRMIQGNPQATPPLSEHDIHLCGVFGREARLHFGSARWDEVCQRLSLHWEALRRADEPSWAMARSLVQQAFEEADAKSPRDGG